MKLKQWAETVTAVVTASVVVGVVGYLVTDAIRTSISEDYRMARVARHDQLCFSLYDPETGTGDPAAESLRQADLPRSFLGKLDLFFLCSHLSELEVAGAKLEAVDAMRVAMIQQAYSDGASAALEQSRPLIALGLSQQDLMDASPGSGSTGIENLVIEMLGTAETVDGGIEEEIIIDDGIFPHLGDGAGLAERPETMEQALVFRA